jgi:hypothetical protein
MNHPFPIARGDATPLLQAVDTTFYSVTTGIEFTIKGKGAARTMRPVTSFRDGMSNYLAVSTNVDSSGSCSRDLQSDDPGTSGDGHVPGVAREWHPKALPTVYCRAVVRESGVRPEGVLFHHRRDELWWSVLPGFFPKPHFGSTGSPF